MKKFVIATVALACMTTGCAASSSAPVTGGLYTSAKGATAATSNALGAKTGESCATSYVGIIGLGDASVESAAKAGDVSKISTVSSDNFGILGLYAKNCTVVTGD